MKLTFVFCTKIALLLFGVVFVVSTLVSYTHIASISRSIIFALFFVYHNSVNTKKHNLFWYFVFFYAFAEVAYLIGEFPQFDRLSYLLGIAGYIMGYLALLLFILKQINFKIVVKKLKLQIIVLLVLGGYVLYSIESMYDLGEIDFLERFAYILEFAYNLLFILVLIAAVLNYLARDTTKRLFLFLACLFLSFSELFQAAYFFVTQNEILVIVYSFLLIISFVFFYYFISLENSLNKKAENIQKEL